MDDIFRKECWNCGWCYAKRGDTFGCKCDDNPDKNEDDYVKEDLGKKGCIYFVPYLELENDNIEKEVSYNVNYTCPYCKVPDTEYNLKDNVGKKLITCWHCKNKFFINWSYE